MNMLENILQSPMTMTWVMIALSLTVMGYAGPPESIQYWGLWRSFDTLNDISACILVVITLSILTGFIDSELKSVFPKETLVLISSVCLSGLLLFYSFL